MRSSFRSHGGPYLQAREQRCYRKPYATSSGSMQRERKTHDSAVLEKYRALVLDGAFRPLAIISWHRALTLDIFRSVEVLEYYDCFVQTLREAYPLPAVLRSDFIMKGLSTVRLPVTKRNILRRDKSLCVYCGSQYDLTIDHVMPVSRGGRSTWENLVAACKTCNNQKGNRTLEQLGWRLKTKPTKPGVFDFRNTIDLPRIQPKEWQDYTGYLKGKGDHSS